MAEGRYAVRRQDNGEYCIWDTRTDAPCKVEADGKPYTNLHFDEAIDRAILLNSSPVR
jgi:hypothetical protein